MLQECFFGLPNYHRLHRRSVSRRRRAANGASLWLAGHVLAWVRPWDAQLASSRACSSLLGLNDTMELQSARRGSTCRMEENGCHMAEGLLHRCCCMVPLSGVVAAPLTGWTTREHVGGPWLVQSKWSS